MIFYLFTYFPLETRAKISNTGNHLKLKVQINVDPRLFKFHFQSFKQDVLNSVFSFSHWT